MTSSCIILAGGQSRRMGRDKRRLRLWGESGPRLLDHMITLAQSVCAEVVVVLNDVDAWPELSVRCVPDAYPGTGPLGGFASGFAAVTHDTALLLACDMPLIPPALLHALLHTPLQHDIRCLCRPPHPPEPFAARYQRRCLQYAEQLLANGEHRMSALLSTATCDVRGPAWWHTYDPTGQSFINLNSTTDLHQLPSTSAEY
jgi:molybdopterin-guanine dinucleotide biosynthesis protein A